jgi:hypothetical protein
VTIDPSGLPSFGAQSTPDNEPETAGLIKPDQDLLKQLLEQMELNHGIDDDGDLFAPYEGFRIFFMFRGEEEELFAVRTYYDRPFKIEDKPKALDLADAWNRDTLWPKIYTHTHEDGEVRFVGEAQLVIAAPVNLDFFVSNVVTWMQASIGFDGWLANELGESPEEKPADEAEAEADAEDGSAKD